MRFELTTILILAAPKPKPIDNGLPEGNRRLQNENSSLKVERDILNKATAYSRK